MKYPLMMARRAGMRASRMGSHEAAPASALGSVAGQITARSMGLASEGGTVLIIVAVSLMSLLGFAGLAIDFGYYFSQKAKMQSLVDSAALACGLKECVQSTAQQNLNAAVLKPINPDNVALGVEIIAAGVAECPADATGCFRVLGSSTQSTFFLKMFNIPTLELSARATSTGGVSGESPGATPAVLALSRTGAGVVFTGSPVFIDGDVNSNSVIGTSGFNTLRVDGSMNARGTIAVSGQTTVRDGINANSAKSFQDPCAGAINKVVIDQAANFASCRANPTPGAVPGATIACPSDKATIPSGTYCSLNFRVPTKCSVTMSGNYFVRDGVSIAGQPNTSLVGTNLFIYNRSNAFEIADIRGVLSMRPSDTGLYRGMLLFQAGSGVTNISATNPATTLDLAGVLYAPDSDLTITAQQTSAGLELTGIVAKSITLASQLRVDTPDKGVCSDFDGGGIAPKRVLLVR